MVTNIKQILTDDELAEIKNFEEDKLLAEEVISQINDLITLFSNFDSRMRFLLNKEAHHDIFKALQDPNDQTLKLFGAIQAKLDTSLEDDSIAKAISETEELKIKCFKLIRIIEGNETRETKAFAGFLKKKNNIVEKIEKFDTTEIRRLNIMCKRITLILHLLKVANTNRQTAYNNASRLIQTYTRLKTLIPNATQTQVNKNIFIREFKNMKSNIIQLIEPINTCVDCLKSAFTLLNQVDKQIKSDESNVKAFEKHEEKIEKIYKITFKRPL